MFKKTGFAIFLCLQFLFTSQTAFSQGSDGPSYIFVLDQVLISGQDYQVDFGGGSEGGEISFVSELQTQVEDPSCQKDDFQIICPGGDGYTATVTADYSGGDIYTGFNLYKLTPEGYQSISSFAVPMVPDGRVVPYRVKVKTLTESGAMVEISIINTSDQVFQGEIDMKVYEPKNEFSDRPFGALIGPGEIVKYTTFIPMSVNGYYHLSFQVQGSESYFPLGGFIYYPYVEDLNLLLPKLGK